MKGCQHKLITGSRKGEICGAKVARGTKYCTVHHYRYVSPDKIPKRVVKPAKKSPLKPVKKAKKPAPPSSSEESESEESESEESESFDINELEKFDESSDVPSESDSEDAYEQLKQIEKQKSKPPVKKVVPKKVESRPDDLMDFNRPVKRPIEEGDPFDDIPPNKDGINIKNLAQKCDLSESSEEAKTTDNNIDVNKLIDDLDSAIKNKNSSEKERIAKLLYDNSFLTSDEYQKLNAM